MKGILLASICLLALVSTTHGLSCIECNYTVVICEPVPETCEAIRLACACCDSCALEQGDACQVPTPYLPWKIHPTCRTGLTCVGEEGETGMCMSTSVLSTIPFTETTTTQTTTPKLTKEERKAIRKQKRKERREQRKQERKERRQERRDKKKQEQQTKG